MRSTNRGSDYYLPVCIDGAKRVQVIVQFWLSKVNGKHFVNLYILILLQYDQVFFSAKILDSAVFVIGCEKMGLYRDELLFKSKSAKEYLPRKFHKKFKSKHLHLVMKAVISRTGFN